VCVCVCFVISDDKICIQFDRALLFFLVFTFFLSLFLLGSVGSVGRSVDRWVEEVGYGSGCRRRMAK
jgi:hypothetical protein